MRRITFIVALLLVLCLALAGCARDTGAQEEGQTNESSVADEAAVAGPNSTDETASPGGIEQIDDDSYADDAAQDLEQDTVAEDNASQSENMNADGTYSWQVGSSILTTSINVMDYIDGNVWHVNDMATALGWDKNKRSTSSRPMTFQMDDTYDVYINFSDASDRCNAIIIKGDNREPISLGLPKQASEYTFNDNDFTMSFEGIVCFAYACEQLSANPNIDPFEGILSGQDGEYSY